MFATAYKAELKLFSRIHKKSTYMCMMNLVQHNERSLHLGLVSVNLLMSNSNLHHLTVKSKGVKT